MYGNIEALKASPKRQEKFPGRFSMVDTLWTCPKSHVDGQNHKNTSFRRALFHKRPSRRATWAHCCSKNSPHMTQGSFVHMDLSSGFRPQFQIPSQGKKWNSKKTYKKSLPNTIHSLYIVGSSKVYLGFEWRAHYMLNCYRAWFNFLTQKLNGTTGND